MIPVYERRRYLWFIAIVGLSANLPCMADESTVEANLNGVKFVFDADTGGILKMSYDGPGVMLDTDAERSSLIDVAYPIPGFEPLRLASRFSHNAKIDVDDKSVTIHFDKLGASREFETSGNVSADVMLKATDDGRSVSMTCTVKNDSDRAVPQVLFPDFRGLVPFAGEQNTEFRAAGMHTKPFIELRRPESSAQGFHAPGNMATYSSGGLFFTTRMILRWMDFGSVEGGFSLFSKRWGFDPSRDKSREVSREHVFMHRSEVDDKLRMACTHDAAIEPHQAWSCPEYILTPHTHGWAEGIEPFRDWVKEHYAAQRRYPLPKHVKEGLGFQTIFLAEQYSEHSLSKTVYQWSDLPDVAKEAKEHGLDEICIWYWCPVFQIPFPDPYPLGATYAEMAAAVKECRELGVNINLFVSFMILRDPSAAAFGVKATDKGWVYHTDLIPRFNPAYATEGLEGYANLNDPKYRQALRDEFKRLNDLGLHSFMWDVYNAAEETYEVSDEIVKLSKPGNPMATFGGETTTDAERDSAFCDYTWNWSGHGDFRPLTSVLPAPRFNMNIDHSPRDVKLAFMDNGYINAMQAAPDGVTGSAKISDFPEFSKALKQCAKLRKQFLRYFTDGTLIGECILTKPAEGLNINGYILPDRGLVIACNLAGERSASFSAQLKHWLKSPTDRYQVKSYDFEGKLIDEQEVKGAVWEATTPPLKAEELIVYEVIPLP